MSISRQAKSISRTSHKFKDWLLDRAWQAFGRGAGGRLREPFEQFRRAEAAWLDDYALFMAIKAHAGRPELVRMAGDLVRREPAALDRARRELADAVGAQQFRQFLFFRQWDNLREHARRLGVKLFGDAPIFVAADSADVWANPEQFLLDKDRRPKVVAGVPPDYFSATGQLWGNPLYDWERMKADGYRLVDRRASRRTCGKWTWFGSTISAASRRPGTSRPAAEDGANRRMGQGPRRRPACGAEEGARRSTPGRRGPGTDLEGSSRPARPVSICRACTSCSSPTAGRSSFAFCRTTTSATRSSTPARTTTTRRSAGGRRLPKRSGSSSANTIRTWTRTRSGT